MPPPNAAQPAIITGAGPNRLISRPARASPNSGTISGPGAMASPARSADQPHTFCSHSTIDSSIAPNAQEKNSATSDAPVKFRDRNSDGWISSVRLFIVCTVNSASSTTAAASTPTIQAEPHPQSPPLTRPNVNSAMPPVMRMTPSGSGLSTSCPGTAGSSRQPAATAARPIGTLTRNTQRQLAATSSPPTTGPSAAASPPVAVHTRTAPDLRSGSYDARIRLSEVGVSSAAPAACTSRNPISIPTLVEAAQAAEASVNTAAPSRNPRSRRYRSASLPKNTSSDAYTIA